MAMDLPPNVPVAAIAAPACQTIADAQVQQAFRRIQARLPSTKFERATASRVCGLVAIKMANGKTAYTDVTGRFFLLAFALDTETGSPADNEQAVEEKLEQLDKFPNASIPGIFPKDYK